MTALWQVDGHGPDGAARPGTGVRVAVAAAPAVPAERPPRARCARRSCGTSRTPADRSLSVTSVCRRFAISPGPCTTCSPTATRRFAATVRGLRLDRCAALLADPATTGTIAEVAAAMASTTRRRSPARSAGASAAGPPTSATAATRQVHGMPNGLHALPGDSGAGRRTIQPSDHRAFARSTTMTVSFLLTPEQEQLKPAARSSPGTHLRDLAAAVRTEPDPLPGPCCPGPAFEKAVDGGLPQGPDPGAVRRGGSQRGRRRDLHRGVGRAEPRLRHLDGRSAHRADARLRGGDAGADPALRRPVPRRLRRPGRRHGVQRTRRAAPTSPRPRRPRACARPPCPTATSG